MPNIRAGDFPVFGKCQTFVRETFLSSENAKHSCRRLSCLRKMQNIRAGYFPVFGKCKTFVRETFLSSENAKHSCGRFSCLRKTPNIRAGGFFQKNKHTHQVDVLTMKQFNC
ncbi:hypothetical protein [Bergeyella zoohelcum]|uniref:hypothetical protein n=1 Tax=Bergeyella zoohelcum TaxID=1015 RepID=UPI0011C01A95|nr:hypothetical protein [Bergeyella zoohelcum]